MKATIHRLVTDKDGECKLTLTIPRSDLPEALKLALLLEQVVEVTIEPEGPT